MKFLEEYWWLILVAIIGYELITRGTLMPASIAPTSATGPLTKGGSPLGSTVTVTPGNGVVLSPAGSGGGGSPTPHTFIGSEGFDEAQDNAAGQEGFWGDIL